MPPEEEEESRGHLKGMHPDPSLFPLKVSRARAWLPRVPGQERDVSDEKV